MIHRPFYCGSEVAKVSARIESLFNVHDCRVGW